MKNKTKYLFAYCCDISLNRGEGILANNFMKILAKVYNRKKILVSTPYRNFFYHNRNIKFEKKLNHSFFYKYFYPFLGIFRIWKYHIKGCKTTYVNFLPLWNFFLFLFLPSKTIIGPITGGVYQGKIFNIETILRKLIIKILYRISIFCIQKKKLKCIFSTRLLFDLLPHLIKKNSIFEFQLFNHVFYKNEKKHIDIIFYNRNYHTKNNIKVINILKKLNKIFNIFIIGDRLESFKNLGIISRKKCLFYLKKTKFVFSTPENTLSYFVLDAISCNAKIITSVKNTTSIYKDCFFYLKNLNEKKIINILKSKIKYLSNKKKIFFIKKKEKNFLTFIKRNYGS